MQEVLQKKNQTNLIKSKYYVWCVLCLVAPPLNSASPAADVDECETGENTCAHGCHNTPGSFVCVCNAAYELGADGKQCYSQSQPPKLCSEMAPRLRCLTVCKWRSLSPWRRVSGIEMEIVNSCENNNGGCSHHCQHSTSGPVCSCNQGYQLDHDLRTCVGRRLSCAEQPEDGARSRISKFVNECRYVVQCGNTLVKLIFDCSKCERQSHFCASLY